MDRLSATLEIKNLSNDITICLDGIFLKIEISAIVSAHTGRFQKITVSEKERRVEKGK